MCACLQICMSMCHMRVGCVGISRDNFGCHPLCFSFETASPPWPEAHLAGPWACATTDTHSDLYSGHQTQALLLCGNNSNYLPRSPPMFLFFSGSGVTVNALHPGVARTELGRHTGIHNSAFSGFMLGESLPAWCSSQSPLPVPSLLGIRDFLSEPVTLLLLILCFSDWVSLFISD